MNTFIHFFLTTKIKGSILINRTKKVNIIKSKRQMIPPHTPESAPSQPRQTITLASLPAHVQPVSGGPAIQLITFLDYILFLLFLKTFRRIDIIAQKPVLAKQPEIVKVHVAVAVEVGRQG